MEGAGPLARARLARPITGRWGALAGTFILALAVLVITHLDLLQHPSGSARNDFRTFYAAFHAEAEGVDLYDVDALSRVGEGVGLGPHVFPYLYPPTLAVVARPLATLSAGAAQRVWDWLALVAMAVAATLAVAAAEPARRAGLVPLVVLLLLLLPVRNNVDMGQVNPIVLVPIATACWAYARGRDRLAGSALAVAALLKLVPAVLLLLWIARRRYRAVWAFVAAGVAGVVLVGLLAGFDRWLRFVGFAMGTFGADQIDGLFGLDVVWSFSPKSVALRAFGPGVAASVTSLAVVVGGAAWLFTRARRAPSDRAAAPLLLGFSALMLTSSPVTYLHHVVYLLPGVVVVLAHATRPPYWLVLLVVIVGTDLPLLYGRVELSASVAPLVTAANLWALLAMAWLSGRDVPGARAPARGRRRSEPAG